MEQCVNDFADNLEHIDYMSILSHHPCKDIALTYDCMFFQMIQSDGSHMLKVEKGNAFTSFFTKSCLQNASTAPRSTQTKSIKIQTVAFELAVKTKIIIDESASYESCKYY